MNQLMDRAEVALPLIMLAPPPRVPLEYGEVLGPGLGDNYNLLSSDSTYTY
jgi:hypothetical protein